MLDSSGRRGLRADGTILDLFPVNQVVGVAGVMLVALFTLAKPEASNGLGFAGRLLFWSLHVGLGLGALWVAGRWLANGRRLPAGTLLPVIVTGLAGALLAAPGYMALDAAFAPHIIDLDPDPPPKWLGLQLVVETLELAPWFLAAWLLINLPVLLPPSQPAYSMSDEVTRGESVLHEDETPPLENPVQMDEAGQVDNPPRHVQSEQQSTGSSDDSVPETKKQQKPDNSFLLSLPGVIGTDLIAVASDLHYLNVWTVAGRTTVLGSLRDVVAELGDAGLQVHRSHWVAHAHVRRVVGNAGNAACIMSNELRVPVSRRRWKEVRAQYGRGVVHTSGTVDT